MPPALRRPSKPSATVGWPPMMWARPEPAKVMMRKPMPIRLLPRPSSGWRNSRKAQTKQHERQQQGHPAERAVDDREDEVGEPALETPPREGGNEHAQGQVEQGGAVAPVLGGEVADVVADPADAGADDVADAEPRTGQHAYDPGLVRLHGGQLPGPRPVAVVLPEVPPAAPRGRADLDAAGLDPRPGELPDLPLEFPLGAEEVRVAILATVPDTRPKAPNFRAGRGSCCPRPECGTASPARRGPQAANGPGKAVHRACARHVLRGCYAR